jgi:hypothetical protein
MNTLNKIKEWFKSLSTTKKIGVIAGSLILLIIIGKANKPNAEEILPKTLGSWSYEKSRIMGGMKISIFYELSISKEGNEYLYNCKETVIDEYNGNVPNSKNYNGKLGEIYQTGEWQGKPEYGIKLNGGYFGEKNCFIALGSSVDIKEILYINFPKGKGDQLIFKKN